MRLAVLASLTATLLLATSAIAHAGGPPSLTAPVEPIAEPPAPTRVQHYGGYVFLADLAVFAASAAVASGDDDGGAAAAISLIGYLGVAPVVHLAYGNKKGAAQSLGLRLLLPVGGAVAGWILAGGIGAEGQCDYCEEGDEELNAFLGGLLGSAIGAGTAMIIDWTVISKRRVPVAGALALRPGLAITPRGATVSLGGSF